MAGIGEGEVARVPAALCGLRLLESRHVAGITKALAEAGRRGISEQELHLLLGVRSGDELEGRIEQLSSIGAVLQAGPDLFLTEIGEELASIYSMLAESPARPVSDSDLLTAFGSPDLAATLRVAWELDLLTHLVLQPASTGELERRIGNRSAINRALKPLRELGWIERGEDRRRPTEYGLTAAGRRLVLLLAAVVRFEINYLGERCEPPGPELAEAGLRVVAQLLRHRRGPDRDIRFEMTLEDGSEVAIVARYRDGVFHDCYGALHWDQCPAVSGSLRAWLDLIVDGEWGRMRAVGRGANTALRSVHPSVTRR